MHPFLKAFYIIFNKNSNGLSLNTYFGKNIYNEINLNFIFRKRLFERMKMSKNFKHLSKTASLNNINKNNNNS